MRNEVKRWVWAIIALMGMLLCYTSCDDKSREESRPDNEYLVDAEILVVDKEGNVVSETPLKSDVSLRSAKTEVESEKGIITGLGLFKASEVAKVKVTAKQGYRFKGMYFKYRGGYSNLDYPEYAYEALQSPTKDIVVTGNITVVALFLEDADYEFSTSPADLTLYGTEEDDYLEGKIVVTSTKTRNGVTSNVDYSCYYGSDLRDLIEKKGSVITVKWKKGRQKEFSLMLSQEETEEDIFVHVKVVISAAPKPVYNFSATPTKLVLSGKDTDSSLSGKISVTSTKTLSGVTTDVGYNTSKGSKSGKTVTVTWRKGDSKNFNVTLTQDESGEALTVPVEVVITETPKPVYTFTATPTKLVLSGKDTDSSLSGKISVTSTKTLSGVTTDVGYNTSKGSKSGKTVTVTWRKGDSKNFNVTLTQDESGEALTVPVEVVITETPKPVYTFTATPTKLVLSGKDTDSSLSGKITVTSTKTLSGVTTDVGYDTNKGSKSGKTVTVTWSKGDSKSFNVILTQDESGKTLTIPVEVVITETPKPVYNFSATPTKLVLSGKDTDSSLSGKITVTSTKTLSGVTTDVGYDTNKGSKSGKTVTVTWRKGESKSFTVTLTQDESGKTLTIPVEVSITQTGVDIVIE